jgi:hypothetical protein
MTITRSKDLLDRSHCHRRSGTDLSADLYRNFSEHLDVPPESDMPLDVRYEIYLSKVVYLRNLVGQCFESFNRQFEGGHAAFNGEEFTRIQNSFIVTRDLIRECVIRSVQTGMERHAQRFCSSTAHIDTNSDAGRTI